MNFKLLNNFIEDKEEIIGLITRPTKNEIKNDHIREVNKGINGWSVLCDLTETEISNTIAQFQGDSTVVSRVPVIFYQIANQIADALSIDKEHVFFQYIYIGENGKVPAHYDAGVPGYVTYKCNICLDGPETDIIHVDKSAIEIKKGDLYCFEANLYKHKLDSSDKTRVHLSYGFILPYADLNWSLEDPRVRLSNRIWQRFMI